MNSLDKVVRYFDLFSRYRTTVARGESTAGQAPSNAWLVAHYAALCAGILAKVFVDSLEGEKSSLSWARMLVALITATAVFPAVYKKTMEESGPSFVQLCVTFTSGLGYKTLIDIKV